MGLSAGHRIDIEAAEGALRVSLRGQVLADSHRAMALHETHLPTQFYLPREDVRAELVDSDTHTLCPFKGRASYQSVKLDGEVLEDVVWYYLHPLPPAHDVAGLLCFDGDRVTIELDGNPA